MSETQVGGVAEHGIPDAAGDDEPKGMPTSHRHQSETAPAANGGNADTEKHQHTPQGGSE